MTTAAFTIVTGIPRSALRAHEHPIGRAPRAHRLAFWALACPGFVHKRVQEHQNEGSQMRRGARTKHQCRSIEDRLQPHACVLSHARRLSTFGLRVWGASGCGAGSPLKTGGQRQRPPNGRAGRAEGGIGECVGVQAARRRPGAGPDILAYCRVGRTEVGRVVAKAESTASRKTKTCPPPFGSSGDRVTIPSFVKTETTRTQAKFEPYSKTNQRSIRPRPRPARSRGGAPTAGGGGVAEQVSRFVASSRSRE